MRGLMIPLVVTAGAAPSPAAAEPPADVTIKLTDYDFQLSQPLTAGKHVVRVENTGAQAHEIVIAALSAGKTLQDFIAWEARSEEHTSELQSQSNLVCRLLLENKKHNDY